MSDTITIPPEACEALQSFITERHGSWLTDEEARAACLAMLRAWPKMKHANNGSSIVLEPHIILPLPQKENEV